MKRFVWVALAFAPLVFGVAACKKAHDAGNDSMRAPGGKITATGSPSVIADAGLLVRSSSLPSTAQAIAQPTAQTPTAQRVNTALGT
jgi:hypothetical protein